MRHILTKIATACSLLGLPAAAQADPISLIAIGANLGFTGTAALVAGAIATYGGYALLGLQIYGGIDARRRAKAAQRDATRRYNASVTDRSVSLLQGTPPWRIVYGEAITGGSVVAIFTSDKTTVTSGGTVGTKPDGLKHLVILMASHEVEALGDLSIDGVSLGTLDGSGYSTSSNWTTGTAEKLVTVTFSNTTTLTAAAASIVSAASLGNQANTFDVDRTVAISGGGLTLTVTDGLGSDPVTVVYKTSINPAVIRVQKHLGSDSQTVDTYLQGLKPTEWDSTHRLRGCAYLVVTLDLEDPRFQGGPPNILCKVKGKKIYDPRKDSTNGGSGGHRYATPSTWEWSDNSALCTRDWIVGEYGMAHDNADILDSFTIAAANACDVTFPLFINGGGIIPDVSFNAPSYRCNGVATTEEGREAVLDKLADSMAGFAIYGAQWQILAGSWTAPVMALTDDDLDGQIEVIQAGAGIDELFNGVRGTYIGATSSSPTDFEPYQNSTFVTADGEPLWQDVGLSFTNSKPHCANIARVLVERGRNSQVIQYPAKLRAWPLQIGDRVTVTSAEYGITTPKTYRVTDWQFGLSAPVTLALQEDAADAYDSVDAVSADPTPNTDLPSPWLVEAVALATPQSGTNHLIRASDGTITTRVWVAWSPLNGAYLKDGQGRVVVRWRRVGADTDWQEIQADASDTGVYLLGVQDDDRVVIEAWATNSGGWRGPSDTKAHTVVGKTAAPANPSGFSATVSKGRVRWAWTPLSDVDYGRTEIRSANSGWGGSGALWSGRASEWPEVVTATGSLTRYIKHFDTTGNQSATAASATLTVTAPDLVQDGANAVVGVLTNEAHVVQTAADGSGGSYGTAGGTFLVFDGLTDKTGNVTVTYSVVSSSGVSISIASTGVYTVSGTSADTATATLRAVYGSVTIDKVYSISRSRTGTAGANGTNGTNGTNGANGADGLSTALVYIYQRATSAPAVPSATATFTFSGATITGLNNGWQATPPSGTDPLYVSVATASSSGATDTIASGEWASPVVLVANGANGSNGSNGSNGVDGLNAATVYLFQRTSSATPPSLPSATVTYTFSTGVASGVNNGWTQTLPTSGGAYRWVTTASALSSSSTDTLASGEWAAASLLAQDGANGTNGTNGADGAPAVSSSLTRLVANFTADSTGVIDGGQSFTTTMQVLLGATDDTGNWSISRTSSDASITTSISGATVTITAIGTGLDTGTVTVTATRSGYPTQTIVVQVGKIKRAVPNNGPVTLAGNLEVVAGTVSPADATAKIQLEADGRITGWVNGTSSNIGNWFLANTGGVGSSYEARFDLLSVNGNTTGTTANALASWGALSTARYVQVQYTTNSGTFTQRQYSFAIRRTSDGVQVCSGQVYLECAVEI